jgi:hypothetical protein
MYTLWELKCGLHIELYAGEMTSSTIMNFSYVVILMCLFIICLKAVSSIEMCPRAAAIPTQKKNLFSP